MDEFEPQPISRAQLAAIKSGEPAILALMARSASPLAALVPKGDYYAVLVAEAHWQFEQSLSAARD